MSAAAAVAPADAAPKKGKKKLIVLLAAVLLVLAGGGGAAVFVMKKKAAEAAAAAEAEEEGEASEGKAAAKHADPKAPPVFLPLEPFVVNLADREVDRFAQVGITLELEDAKAADQLKLYMPAIRNGILMILAHKTSAELQERTGKEKLAREIARAAVLPMGIEVPSEEELAAQEDEAAKAAGASGKKKKRAKAAVETPVKAVNFSSFIIQ